MCYPIAIFNTTLCSEMRAMKHLLFCALLACSGVASAAALDWDITTADYVSAGGSDTSPGGRNYSIDCLTGDSFQLSLELTITAESGKNLRRVGAGAMATVTPSSPSVSISLMRTRLWTTPRRWWSAWAEAPSRS